MHQEAVLEAAAGAIGVAEIVDGGSAGVDARLERGHYGVAQRRELGTSQGADRTQRVDPRPEQGLVRVDVAHAGDPLLGSRKAFTGARRPAASARSASAREVGLKRLHPEPSGEVLLERLAPSRTTRSRSGAGRRTAPASRRPARGGRGGGAGRRHPRPRHQEQVASHPEVHHEEDLVLQRDDEVLAAARDASTRRPATASASSAGWAGSHQRGSSTSSRSSRRPSTYGASWRRSVSTSGSSGMPAVQQAPPGRPACGRLSALWRAGARGSTRP